MKSVRVRLLILALLPLVVLLPLLLGLGMSRWGARFDSLLIENVASDLRIAEQYLQRILTGTETEIRGLATSTSFADALRENGPEFDARLEQYRQDLGLDFLRFVSGDAVTEQAERWPVIKAAAQGGSRTSIDIFDATDLALISPDLALMAQIPLIETEAAVQTDRSTESRGMIVHTATWVGVPGRKGVLVGGTLLNRNLGFIDTINDLVYRQGGNAEARQGTATLFLEDVRVSTNVRLFEDVRALGTRVSAEVYGAVLDDGKTWLNRAFVVNDWYISGYLPLKDSFGNRVGMLYVGFLEAPFAAAKRASFAAILGAVMAVLAVSVPLFLRMATGVFAPLERMSQTMSRVEDGDLTARIGSVQTQDEIGEVAAHLDTLLDQVQDRDAKLRSWAQELNTRVDRRTQELSDANKKLEATFQQLVMSEKLASIGEITAGVAHEINNPIAVIQGNVDVMREALGEHAKDVATELTLIDQQVSRINAIVGKLLQFARPTEFGALEETVDAGQVLSDCLVLVDHALRSGRVKIVKNIVDAPPVRINPGELQQILINLIMNALQAMQDQGVLELSVTPKMRDDQSGLEILVIDSGEGIEPEKLDDVFDPFFTTKLAEGTGLGLSISQTLVQRAGGLISVRNRRRGGAEFSVWLPSVTEGGKVAAQ